MVWTKEYGQIFTLPALVVITACWCVLWLLITEALHVASPIDEDTKWQYQRELEQMNTSKPKLRRLKVTSWRQAMLPPAVYAWQRRKLWRETIFSFCASTAGLVLLVKSLASNDPDVQLLTSYSFVHQVLFSMVLGHWLNRIWEDWLSRQLLGKGIVQKGWELQLWLFLHSTSCINGGLPLCYPCDFITRGHWNTRPSM